MDIRAAQQVREGLGELIRFVNDAGTPTADLRAVLEESKSFSAQLSVLQGDAAAVVAARERHGDRGAGVLAQAAGLSRREAAGQVKTAERLQSMPAVRDAVESGEISFTNAKALADACEKTSAEQVQGDSGLLDKAADLSPERFAKEAGRWAAQHQDDGGESDYQRQRARRRLSIWDGDDGMVHLRGELDPVSGSRMRNRLLKEAERLRRTDINSPGGEQRSFHQRMADALDTLTADSSGNGAGRPSASITIVQHLTAGGTEAFAEIAGGATIPRSVLEEHMCNAPITPVVFSSKGVPLWRGHTISKPTQAQMDALKARYGGCGGCGADFAVCQGHHITPVSQGGSTDIDNLMPLCWGCHQKVHRHGWQAVPSGDLFTVEPADRLHYGPARAPSPPPTHRRPAPPARGRPAPPGAAQPPARSSRAEPARPDEGRAEFAPLSAAQPPARPGRAEQAGPDEGWAEFAPPSTGPDGLSAAGPWTCPTSKAGPDLSSPYQAEPLFSVT